MSPTPRAHRTQLELQACKNGQDDLMKLKNRADKWERIVIFLTLSIRRSYRVQFLSAKNRKLYLLFTHAHQNWTMEHRENFAWFNESVCCNICVSVRMCCKQHESMDTSCFLSAVQVGGGVMLWGIVP